MIERADAAAAGIKGTKRQSATRKLRLPGNLPTVPTTVPKAPSHRRRGRGAGGSAKQARDRKSRPFTAPGKILNVASATRDKLAANREPADGKVLAVAGQT